MKNIIKEEIKDIILNWLYEEKTKGNYISYIETNLDEVTLDGGFSINKLINKLTNDFPLIILKEIYTNKPKK